ncbi:MAG: rod shape-determining protein MreC, partial [Endomicrobiaceae bacterium]|nr:rod shape-determining protein MreC [Endomicrobiaceae bacterium]
FNINKNKSHKHADRLFWVLICISLLLISARLTPTIQAMKYLAYSVLSPTLKLTSDSFTGTNNLIINIINIIKVNQENIKLKKQLLDLSDQLKDYQSLINDNVRLRQLLNLPQKNHSTTIFANVIIREPSQWYQWMIINKGSEDGIKQDSPVIAIVNNSQYCAFGRIVEIYKSTSKVALLTNSLSSIPAQIKNSQIDCLADGYNSQYLKLNYIPQFVELNIGDEIITSQLNSSFDKGIDIGKIVKISKTNSGEYSDVSVMPYSQMERVYEVVVLVPNEEN